MLRAMLSKKLVHHVQAEIGRTQNTAIGKRPLNKDGQSNKIFERTAEFLQI
jgi:hypothetical protein